MDHAPSHIAEPTVAREVITIQVVQVAPETGVQDAVRLLGEHRIGAVPVVDAAGMLVGMASGNDLLRSVSRRFSRHGWGGRGLF